MSCCTPKGVRVLRGYFGPPMRPKNENAFHKFLLISLLEHMAQVLKSGIDSILTIAMVTKTAA